MSTRFGCDDERIARHPRDQIEDEERAPALDPSRLTEDQRLGQAARRHHRATEIGEGQRSRHGELEIDPLVRVLCRTIDRRRDELEASCRERPDEVQRLCDRHRRGDWQRHAARAQRDTHQLETAIELPGEQEVLAGPRAQRGVICRAAEAGREIGSLEHRERRIAPSAEHHLGLGELLENIEPLRGRQREIGGPLIELDGTREGEGRRRVRGGAARPQQRPTDVSARVVVARKRLGLGDLGALEHRRESEVELAAELGGHRCRRGLSNAVVIGLDVSVGIRGLDQLPAAKLIQRGRIERQVGGFEQRLPADRASRDRDQIEDPAGRIVDLGELPVQHGGEVDRVVATVATMAKQPRQQIGIPFGLAQRLLARQPGFGVVGEPIVDRGPVEGRHVHLERGHLAFREAGQELFDEW